MIPKIKTAKEKEKAEKLKGRIIAVAIIVILGASSAAYAFLENGSDTKAKYNGITFTRTDQGWQPKGISIATDFLPQEVENITSYGFFDKEDFKGNVYIIAEGSLELNSANELLRALSPEKANLACLPEEENETFCIDLPIKSCEDAAINNAVIIYTESNITSIKCSKYCLVISGNDEDTVKATDKAIFKFYNIIE